MLMHLADFGQSSAGGLFEVYDRFSVEENSCRLGPADRLPSYSNTPDLLERNSVLSLHPLMI